MGPPSLGGLEAADIDKMIVSNARVQPPTAVMYGGNEGLLKVTSMARFTPVHPLDRQPEFA
jgi:hypothetical protein